MPSSFFASAGSESTDIPIESMVGPSVGDGQCAAQRSVGPDRLSHCGDDAQWFGSLAAQTQARYERTGCLSAAGDRDRWLMAQREVIERGQGAASRA